MEVEGHMAPAKWDAAIDCVTVSPVVSNFPSTPAVRPSKVSRSPPRLKLRYGRKIYSIDEISLVILFITELHPHMKC